MKFNPFSAEFRRDPYPAYRALRETPGVSTVLGTWVLTRHADVRAVLRDRTFSSDLIPQQIARVSDADRLTRLTRKSLVFTDNPDHARLRGLLNRVFTARTVQTLRPSIARAADRLIEDALRDGGMDAIEGLAAPLPVVVLGDWMDLPEDVRCRVAEWTHDIRYLLEPGLLTAVDVERVGRAVDEFSAALEAVVAERRKEPGTDLVSGLLGTSTGAGDRLSDEELIFVLIMCFVAGTETTRALIGNGLLALLGAEDQGALVRAEPGRIPAAVEEAVRYDSPLQLTKRLVTRDVEVAGARLRPGDQVLLCLGAANRDPAVFDRPDEFDVRRDAGAHVGFGYGMHGCLGGMLAVLQTTVAFERLFARPERLVLADEPLEWQADSMIVRGLTRLPVAVA